jgi:hypothetical protein
VCSATAFLAWTPLDWKALERYSANHTKGHHVMNPLCLLATGTLLMSSLAVHVQQAPPTTSSRNDAAGVGTPTVDEQLKMFTEKLDLTGHSASEDETHPAAVAGRDGERRARSSFVALRTPGQGSAATQAG